jgi:hypothetical protein
MSSPYFYTFVYVCSKHGIEYLKIIGSDGISVSYDQNGHVVKCKFKEDK